MQQYIKSLGYRVFIRPNGQNPTYCFYTDGIKIGYAQWGSINSGVSSVHKPNPYIGTGFHVSDVINAHTLQQALTMRCPWTDQHHAGRVLKYRDMQDYLDSSLWNSSLVEI